MRYRSPTPAGRTPKARRSAGKTGWLRSGTSSGTIWASDSLRPLSIALVATLVYANAVGNGYTLDDKSVILNNGLIHSLSGVWRAFLHPYWPEAWARGQYRPLTILSFTLQWLVGHGAAWPFHVVSIAWHVAACLWLWRVLRQMVSPDGAWLAAMWFAVQPVHVEAVASAVGQSELMAATFALAAWLAHRNRAVAAPFWFALALLSKESGIVVPLLLLGADWCVDGDGVRAALVRRRTLYLAYALVSTFYLAAWTTLFASQAMSVGAPTWSHATVIERWATMVSVIPQFVRLLVAPTTLQTDYVPRVVELETGLTPAVAFGLVLAVTIAFLALLARRRARAASYGIGWIVIAIAPVANIVFPSGVVIAERTLYLPSVGAALIVGWLAERLVRVRPRLAASLALAGGVLLALRTWTRTPDWHDDIALIESALRDTPLSYQAHHSAGVLLAFQGRWAEAAVEYRKSRALFPYDGDPYRGGAECAIAMRNYAEAAALLDSARRMHPMQVTPTLRLAQVRWMQHRWRESEALALAAYELAPDSVLAIDLAAGSAMQQGDIGEAASLLRRGMRDHPADASLRAAYDHVAATRVTPGGRQQSRGDALLHD